MATIFSFTGEDFFVIRQQFLFGIVALSYFSVV